MKRGSRLARSQVNGRAVKMPPMRQRDGFDRVAGYVTENMMRGPRALALSLLVALVIPAHSIAQDHFYVERLQSGRIDFAAGRLADSERDLRVAAFGLMDYPRLLGESLVRLAVVEKRLGRDNATADAIARFVELERAASVLATLEIEEPVRSEFVAMIRSLPRETVAGIASFQQILVEQAPAPGGAAAGTNASRPAAKPEAETNGAAVDLSDQQVVLAQMMEFDRSGEYVKLVELSNRALKAGAERNAILAFRAHAAALRGLCGDALRDFGTLGDSIAANEALLADKFVCLVDAQRWKEAEALADAVSNGRTDVGRAHKALEEQRARSATSGERPPAPAAEAPAMPRPAVEAPPDARMFLAKAAALLKEGRAPEAVPLIKAVLDVEPGNRAAHLLLLEAATVSRDFPTAAAQVSAIGAFMSGEEVSMFYAAVAMYETGHVAEAKGLLERARPGVSRSPYVDAYVAKIAR